MAKHKQTDPTTANPRAPKISSSKRRRTEAPPANNEAHFAKRVKIEPVESLTGPNQVGTEREVRNKVYDDIVFLKVGPAATKFGIHRGLLIKYSSFFKKILKLGDVSDTKDVAVALEEGSRVVTLPDEDPKVFSRVNSWLYSQVFRIHDEAWKDIDWQHLINVYVFAVQKGMPILHNCCIHATILKVQDGGLFPGQGTINSLWKPGVNVTPLRMLFVKLFAVHCNLKSAILSNDAYNQMFLNQLVIELYEMQSKGIRPEEVDVWKARMEYWMHGPENPIAVG